MDADQPAKSGEVVSTVEQALVGNGGRRRKPYQRITHTEIVEVLDLYARHIKQVEIARATGLSEQRVSEIILEFEPTEEMAKLKLRAKAKQAADLWTGEAMQKAARRGDSTPAERLLKAVGVVQPDSAQMQVLVQVNSPLDPTTSSGSPYLSAHLSLPADIPPKE